MLSEEELRQGSSLNETNLRSVTELLGGLEGITAKFCIVFAEGKTEGPCALRSTIKSTSRLSSYSTKETYLLSGLQSRDQSLPDMGGDEAMDPSNGKVLCCANKANGCAYETSAKNKLLKHERWLCRHTFAKCKWGCASKLGGVSRIDHFATCHATNMADDFNKKIYENDVKYNRVVFVESTKFLCQWVYHSKASTFSIDIVTDLEADAVAQYTCIVEMINVITKARYEKTVNKCVWKNIASNWDYSTSFTVKNNDVELYTLLLKIY